MSDLELRELERRYAAGELDVFPRLINMRFHVEPSLQNAQALFDHYRTNRLPLDLTEGFMQVLLASPDSNLFGLAYLNDIRILGLNVREPDFRLPYLEPLRNNLINVVRNQLPDDDIEEVRRTHQQRGMRAAEIAHQVVTHNVQTIVFGRFRDRINEVLGALNDALQEIQDERDELRGEFARYLDLLNHYEPLEAGKEWYRLKCEAYTKETGVKVLSPDDLAIYYDGGYSNPESAGVYSPECFFPFYDFLSSEYVEEAPRANFLAAVEPDSHDFYYGDGWEEEYKEEEAESYADELGISYDELVEGDEHYDEYRDFEDHFERVLLPKKKLEKIEEIIDESVGEIITKYIESYEAMPIKELWSQMAEGYAGDYEVFYEIGDWLDDDSPSLVSDLVNEPFEHWEYRRGRTDEWPTPRVIPLEKYSQQRRYGLPTRSASWWDLTVEPACRKPPAIKADTRAIGWKAAFGIEPLIL